MYVDPLIWCVHPVHSYHEIKRETTHRSIPSLKKKKIITLFSPQSQKKTKISKTESALLTSRQDQFVHHLAQIMMSIHRGVSHCKTATGSRGFLSCVSLWRLLADVHGMTGVRKARKSLLWLAASPPTERKCRTESRAGSGCEGAVVWCNFLWFGECFEDFLGGLEVVGFFFSLDGFCLDVFVGDYSVMDELAFHTYISLIGHI